MVKWILIEILEVPAERSRGRHNPRVVRSRGKLFPIKPKRSEPADPHPAINYDDCIRIVPPDRLCKIMREAADRRRKIRKARRRKATQSTNEAYWRAHVRSWVRSWRASNLSRVDYSRNNGLVEATFSQWIAKLRHKFRHGQSNSRNA
jgi:hypothetical protein